MIGVLNMKNKFLISFIIMFCIMIIPMGVEAKESLGTCRYIVHGNDLDLEDFFPSNLYLNVTVYDDGSTGKRKIGFDSGWNDTPSSGLLLGDTPFLLMYSKMFDKNGDFYQKFTEYGNCPPMQFSISPGTNNIWMRVKDFVSSSPGEISYTANAIATGGNGSTTRPIYYCRNKEKTLDGIGNGYIYLEISTIKRNNKNFLSISAYTEPNNRDSLIDSAEVEAGKTLTLSNGGFPLSFIIRNEDIDTYWSDGCSDAPMYFEMMGGSNTNLSIQTVQPEDGLDAAEESAEWEQLEEDVTPDDFNKDVNFSDIFDLDTPGSFGYILNTVLNYIKIIGPILVVLLSAVDFIKAVVGTDEKAMKEAQSKLVIRLVAALGLFLVPTLVQLLLSFINVSVETIG